MIITRLCATQIKKRSNLIYSHLSEQIRSSFFLHYFEEKQRSCTHPKFFFHSRLNPCDRTALKIGGFGIGQPCDRTALVDGSVSQIILWREPGPIIAELVSWRKIVNVDSTPYHPCSVIVDWLPLIFILIWANVTHDQSWKTIIPLTTHDQTKADDQLAKTRLSDLDYYSRSSLRRNCQGLGRFTLDELGKVSLGQRIS